MPRMSVEDLKRWNDSLAASHRLWGMHGMTADHVGSRVALGPKGAAVWQYLRAYRGDPWSGDWGGIDQSLLGVTTLAFSTCNTWSAGLLARNPKVQVLPRLRTGTKHATEVARDAISVQALYNYDIHRMKWWRQLNAALFASFFSPLGGIIRHGFSPAEEVYASDGVTRIERYNMAEPDKPWIRSTKMWDIRIDPSGANFLPDEDANWVAFRQLRTLDEIKKNPNLRSRRDLRANVRLEPGGPGSMRSMIRGSPDLADYVESWVVYDKRDRTWFELVEGLEKPLRDPEDWPIPWKDLPFDLLQFNPQMDTAFQFPYMAAIFPSIVELNKLQTILLEVAKRARRMLFVNQMSLADGEWEKMSAWDGPALTEFFLTKDGNDPNTVFSQAAIGTIDTSLLALYNQLVVNIREAIGQSSLDRAQRINVETAAEANAVQAGSQVNAGRNQTFFEDFLQSVVRHYAISRQHTTTEDELLHVLGREDSAVLLDTIGAEPFFRVTPEQLRGEFDYEITAGSTLPRDRQQDVALAMGLMNLIGSNQTVAQHLNIQNAVLEMVLAMGKNPSTAMMSDREMMGAAQKMGPGDGKQKPSPDMSNMVDVLSSMRGQGGVTQ